VWATGRITRLRAMVLLVRRGCWRCLRVQALPVPPSHHYALQRGQHLEVDIRQSDGGRALVVGQLDAIPLATWGGGVMRIRVWAERVMVLEAEQTTSASDFTDYSPSP
jgi:hypothetical protein